MFRGLVVLTAVAIAGLLFAACSDVNSPAATSQEFDISGVWGYVYWGEETNPAAGLQCVLVCQCGGDMVVTDGTSDANGYYTCEMSLATATAHDGHTMWVEFYNSNYTVYYGSSPTFEFHSNGQVPTTYL